MNTYAFNALITFTICLKVFLYWRRIAAGMDVSEAEKNSSGCSKNLWWQHRNHDPV